jgi:hypothetical protein
MTAHIGSVDVGHRHVEARAGPADLLRRGHDRFGPAQHLAHGIAARRMPQRGMVEFARLARNGALAVALDHGRVAAQRLDQALRHGEPQRLQVSMKPSISGS